MVDKQPSKIFGKIFGPVKRRIDKIIQEETNKRLEDRVEKLEDLLKEMNKKVQEKAYLSEIRKNFTEIDLRCHKERDGLMLCGYDITTYPYNKDNDEVSECHSNTISYKIKCTDYIGKPLFELYDPPRNSQGISFRVGIKDSFLDMYKILHPDGPIDMDKQYIHIRGIAYMDLDKSIKENPVIIKDNNLLIYYNGRTSIKIFYGYY